MFFLYGKDLIDLCKTAPCSTTSKLICKHKHGFYNLYKSIFICGIISAVFDLYSIEKNEGYFMLSNQNYFGTEEVI